MCHLSTTHIVHLSHEFTFESFTGQHICFVMDILSYDVPTVEKELDDGPRLPLEFILRITRDVLKGLEYLHDECKVVHSGISYAFFVVSIGWPYYLTDLKPQNILLLPSDIDKIIMNKLSEQLSTLWVSEDNPTEQTSTSPGYVGSLIFDLDLDLDLEDVTEFHWVIMDLGHSMLTQCKLWVNCQGLNILQLTHKENT